MKNYLITHIKSNAIVVFFLAIVSFGFGQERICIPDVLFSKKVKGTLFMNNGDSISGAFTHLTPENDIETTHIIVKTPESKVSISRREIQSYYDDKEQVLRYGVYTKPDSVFVKKECRYDLAVFMIVMVDGEYRLLKNKIEPSSSIQEYNQSENKFAYYIFTPDSKLIELVINDLKPQMKSLFYGKKEVDELFSEESFNIDTVIEIITIVNESK